MKNLLLLTPLLFVVPTDGPLTIGRESWGGDPPNGSTPALMTGRLDEIQIFARALSPADVAKLAVK